MTLDLTCCTEPVEGVTWTGTVTGTGTLTELSQLFSKDPLFEVVEVSYFSISANKSKLSVSVVPRRSIGSMSISPSLSTCSRSDTKSFRSPQNSKRRVGELCQDNHGLIDIDHFHNQRTER